MFQTLQHSSTPLLHYSAGLNPEFQNPPLGISAKLFWPGGAEKKEHRMLIEKDEETDILPGRKTA